MIQEPNDPTRTGGPVPHGGAVLLSRNEVETLCAKAARGAGMGWGHADEAGGAAGWLHAHGIDGATALLAHLDAAAGTPWPDVSPVVGAGRWSARGAGPLCPVAVGVTLCDYRDLPEGNLAGAGLSLATVGSPILLLPFLSDIARYLGSGLTARWGGGAVHVDGQGNCGGDVEGLAALRSAAVELMPRAARIETVFAAGTKPCDGAILARLNDLAMKTTVPQSEKSRADAGAGTSDND